MNFISYSNIFVDFIIMTTVLTSGLDKLLDFYRPHLSSMEKLLVPTHASSRLIPAISDHLVTSGGKRLRPLLTIISACAGGYQGARHHQLAAVVELIHTATLLHDDVVDESLMRRNSPTANAKWGSKASILVGDYLFSHAFQLMVADGELQVLRVLADTAATIASGEVLQLEELGNLNLSYESYLEIISAKTASLFSAACKVGAIVSGMGAEQIDALASYGHKLGIAFQMIDDLLDYSANKTGKNAGDDFYEGKITLPVLLLLQQASFEVRDTLTNMFTQQEFTVHNYDYCLEQIERYSVMEGCRKLAFQVMEEACLALEGLPKSIHREHLAHIVHITKERMS